MNALRAVALLVSFTGTSPLPPSPCAHAAATSVAFSAKAEGCRFERASPYDADSCRAATDLCTGADREALDAFLGCLDAMPSCGEGGEAAWRAQFEACAANARLSEGCSL